MYLLISWVSRGQIVCAPLGAVICDTVKLCVHLPQPVKMYLGTCILESTVCIPMACMYEYKSSLAWTCIVKRSVCVT